MAHLINVPFGGFDDQQTSQWWGGAWRQRREFVGQVGTPAHDRKRRDRPPTTTTHPLTPSFPRPPPTYLIIRSCLRYANHRCSSSVTGRTCSRKPRAGTAGARARPLSLEPRVFSPFPPPPPPRVSLRVSRDERSAPHGSSPHLPDLLLRRHIPAFDKRIPGAL